MGEVGEQRLAEPGPARGGADIEIFEIEPGPAFEGGKIVEEQGKALRDAGDFADQDFGHRAGAEQVLLQLFRREADFVGELFISGEFMDQRADQRQIGRGGWADGERHAAPSARLADGVQWWGLGGGA